ncbi:MAG: hypothetical protein IJO64_07535, partial [Clostridia bacterium]|nr:hypothetical protein [Clostridia bacterium]
YNVFCFHTITAFDFCAFIISYLGTNRKQHAVALSLSTAGQSLNFTCIFDNFMLLLKYILTNENFGVYYNDLASNAIWTGWGEKGERYVSLHRRQGISETNEKPLLRHCQPTCTKHQ